MKQFQDVYPATTEYQPYVSLPTTTSQDVTTSDHTISTTSSTSVLVASIQPVMSLSTPPTTSATVSTSVSLPSTIGTKFTVEIVSDGSDDEMVEEPVESIVSVSDVPYSHNNDATVSVDETSNVPVTIDDAGKLTSSTATCSLRSDSSNSFYDEKIQRAPKVEGSRPVYQQSAPSPVFQGCAGTERPSESPMIDNLSKLSESFSVLMYSILQVLRNPAMESFINDLDTKYGNGIGSVSQEYHDPEYQNLQMKLVFYYCFCLQCVYVCACVCAFRYVRVHVYVCICVTVRACVVNVCTYSECVHVCVCVAPRVLIAIDMK